MKGDGEDCLKEGFKPGTEVLQTIVSCLCPSCIPTLLTQQVSWWASLSMTPFSCDSQPSLACSSSQTSSCPRMFSAIPSCFYFLVSVYFHFTVVISSFFLSLLSFFFLPLPTFLFFIIFFYFKMFWTPKLTTTLSFLGSGTVISVDFYFCDLIRCLTCITCWIYEWMNGKSWGVCQK